MIIVNLLVANKEQGDAVANILIKNKYTLNVFGNTYDSFQINSVQSIVHASVYVLQFVTKSMLFNEIEAELKKAFPQTDFNMCSTPIVHMVMNLHHKIKQRVIGKDLIDEEA